MSRITLKFHCPDCGQDEVNVTTILDGQRDNVVKEYPDSQCPKCEDKLRYVRSGT